MANKTRAGSVEPSAKKTPGKKQVETDVAVTKKKNGSKETGFIAELTKKWNAFSFMDQVALIWFGLDAMTHLTMEANFLYFATLKGGAAANLDNPAALIWNLYGRADKRWAQAWEPGTLSVEFPTVFIAGFGALFIFYGIWTHQKWRHLLAVIISTIEIIGNWYTFAPDLFDWMSGKGSALAGCMNADGSLKFIEFWVFIVFMNSLWLALPIVIVWDSSARLIAAADATKVESSPSPIPRGAWTGSLGYLIAYAIAVPAVIVYEVYFNNALEGLAAGGQETTNA